MGGCMMLTFEKASNKQRKYIGNVLLIILIGICLLKTLSNFFTQNTLAYCIERWLPGTKYSSAAFWWCHFICNILMAIIVYVLIEKKLTKFIVKRV